MRTLPSHINNRSHHEFNKYDPPFMWEERVRIYDTSGVHNNFPVFVVHLKSELIVCIHRINHNGQYLKSFNIVVFSATNKVSSESLGAIISKIFRLIDEIIVGIQV